MDESVAFDNDETKAQPLFEHLKRSFDHVVNHLGPHGLPLIGRADWNDRRNHTPVCPTLIVLVPQSAYRSPNTSAPVAKNCLMATKMHKKRKVILNHRDPREAQRTTKNEKPKTNNGSIH